MRRRLIASSLAGGLVLTLTAPALTAPASAAGPVAALGLAVSTALAGSHATAMSVRVDIAGAGTVYSRYPAQTLNPASTEKLLTGYTALKVLGPAHRFVTTVGSTVAPDPHGVLHGRLVVTAGGDPTLSTNGLAALARRVRANGVRTVTGGLLLDDSMLSRVRVAPHGTTSLDLGDPGPLSAFAVNQNRWRVDGSYRADPTPYNLQALRQALVRAGVSVDGPLQVGRPPRAARPVRLLASTASAPLSSIVHDMLKNSVNFYAETLLEDIGAARGSGTQAVGVQAIRALSTALHVSLGGNIEDGSGLSTNDRQSANGEVAWLEAAHADPLVSAQLVADLPIGCVDGTLRHRLCGVASPVHAKTGTLDGVRALSGYVTDAAGHLATFAFLVAGPLSTATSATRAIDAAVRAIAASHV